MGAIAWRWRSAARGFAAGAVPAALALFLLDLLYGMDLDPVPSGLVVAFCGMIGTGYGGWRREVPPVEKWTTRSSVSVVRNSFRVIVSLVLVWTVIAVLSGLASGWKLSDVFPFSWLVASVVVSPAIVLYRGYDPLLHAALRLALWICGALPFRLRAFLDYAVHLGFLQRAGGGYRFFHGYLQAHFAKNPARADAANHPVSTQPV